MPGADEKNVVPDGAALIAAYRRLAEAPSNSKSWRNELRPALEYAGGAAGGDLKLVENRTCWEADRRYTFCVLLCGGPTEDREMAQDGIYGFAAHHKPCSLVTLFLGPPPSGPNKDKGMQDMLWMRGGRVTNSVGKASSRKVSELFARSEFESTEAMVSAALASLPWHVKDFLRTEAALLASTA